MNRAAAQEIRLGPWSVSLIECGRLALDGGAMFGSVPRAIWQRLIPPDAAHRIPLAMRLLLLRNEQEGVCALVDTGAGDKFDRKFQEMFAVENPPAAPGGGTPLEGAVLAAGVQLAELTHVLLTHLHFDHGGGVTRRREGVAVPVFPDAEHFLQRRNFETARRPNPRERASYFAENVEPLAGVKLTLIDGEAEVLPGVRVLPSDGHTAGLQIVRVEGGGEILYYLSDLAPTQHHLHLPYSMGYDLCAFTVMEEKTRLLPKILEENAIVVFEHDAQLALAHLALEQGRFRVGAPVAMRGPAGDVR